MGLKDSRCKTDLAGLGGVGLIFSLSFAWFQMRAKINFFANYSNKSQEIKFQNELACFELTRLRLEKFAFQN
jgi:hypothetical protein